MKRSLQQIAEAVGARLIGDGTVEVGAVASMESATPQDLVFVEDEKHFEVALQSRAGAIIAGESAATLATSAPGHSPTPHQRSSQTCVCPCRALVSVRIGE